MDTTLKHLLDAGAVHDAEYGGGLTNHLPMALVALHRLGADSTRLAAFAERHAKRLQPAPPAEAWPRGDAWPDRLGQREAWPAYRALFAEWLEEEGADDVLQQALPVLIDGCGAAAFHGLIRTAYGLDIGHKGEIADGLAYWACRHLALPGLDTIDPVDDDSTDIADLYAQLRADLGDWQAPGRLIFEKVQAAAQLPDWRAAVARLQVDEHTLSQLARTHATMHAAGGDFTVLHLVTSAHALRLLLPFFDEPLQAVWHYATASLAAYAAAGRRDDPRAAVTTPAADDAAIAAAARASDDDHVIKLVYTAQAEHAAHGHAAHRAAAARAVRLA